LTNINDFENLLINLRTPNPFIKPFKTALNNLKHEIFYKIDNKMATVIDTLWSFYSLFDGRKKKGFAWNPFRCMAPRGGLEPPSAKPALGVQTD